MAVLINPNPVVHDLQSRPVIEHKEKSDISLFDAQDIFGNLGFLFYFYSLFYCILFYFHQTKDLICHIKDPEHPFTLQQLDVVKEELVNVKDDGKTCFISIEFTPTVPHCNLATTIGLCLQRKLSQELNGCRNLKLDISITPGSHATANEVTKQINDKERVSAALENPYLRGLVEDCIKPKEF
jgi:metal-sulfur cluster biosynthetic enzyme